MAKAQALISYAASVQLLCTFVFAYAKSRFSDDASQYNLRFILSLFKVQIIDISGFINC